MQRSKLMKAWLAFSIILLAGSSGALADIAVYVSSTWDPSGGVTGNASESHTLPTAMDCWARDRNFNGGGTAWVQADGDSSEASHKWTVPTTKNYRLVAIVLITGYVNLADEDIDYFEVWARAIKISGSGGSPQYITGSQKYTSTTEDEQVTSGCTITYSVYLTAGDVYIFSIRFTAYHHDTWWGIYDIDFYQDSRRVFNYYIGFYNA